MEKPWGHHLSYTWLGRADESGGSSTHRRPIQTGGSWTPEVPTEGHGSCSPTLEEAGSFRPA